jgi:hypothetical protein
MASGIAKLIGVPSNLNPGVSSAKQATMLALLGNPRSSFDAACREVTNPVLKGLIDIQSVGPFRVQGLRPAVAVMKTILEEIRTNVPDVHAGIGTAGMLCARLVRGSEHAISNHSWGTAIDLTLDGILDTRGDNLVQEGLTRIAPIFNAHGWFWGAGFRTEDAMHFEAGDELIRQWHTEGQFGGPPRPAPERLLTLGDRGPEVLTLQHLLNSLGAEVVEDSVFGTGTRAAVTAFQGAHGLRPDGVVGPQTLAALGV